MSAPQLITYADRFGGTVTVTELTAIYDFGLPRWPV